MTRVAKVVEMQVDGIEPCFSLKDACATLTEWEKRQGEEGPTLTKIHFLLVLPNGEQKSITIRDDGKETVAYGDFEGLGTFLDFAAVELSPEDKFNLTEHKED